MAAADIALHHLLTIRLESISEQNQFLDSLAKDFKFQKLVRRFYPSNQEFGTSELIGLIIAARKDSSGLLLYDACYSTVSSPVYSRRLPFVLAARNSRITETGIAAPCILTAASMVKTCPMVRQNAFSASGAQDTKLKV